MLLNLGNCLDAAVILTETSVPSAGAQSLLNIGDYLSPSPVREANFFLARSSSMASS